MTDKKQPQPGRQPEHKREEPLRKGEYTRDEHSRTPSRQPTVSDTIKPPPKKG